MTKLEFFLAAVHGRLHVAFAHIRTVEHDFWARARPRTVQFIMGVASFLWAYACMAEADTGFMNRAFDMMRALAPAWSWSLLFGLHGVLVLRCRWALTYLWSTQLATNLFGFVLWTFYVVSTWCSLGRPAIGTMLEIVMIFMMGWLIYRTLRKPASPATALSIYDTFTEEERIHGNGDALALVSDGL